MRSTNYRSLGPFRSALLVLAVAGLALPLDCWCVQVEAARYERTVSTVEIPRASMPAPGSGMPPTRSIEPIQAAMICPAEFPSPRQ